MAFVEISILVALPTKRISQVPLMSVPLAVAVKIALLSRNAAKQFMYTDLSVFPNFVTVK